MGEPVDTRMFSSTGGLASVFDGGRGKMHDPKPPPQRCEHCRAFLNSHSIERGFTLCNACVGKLSIEERYRYTRQIQPPSRKPRTVPVAEEAEPVFTEVEHEEEPPDTFEDTADAPDEL